MSPVLRIIATCAPVTKRLVMNWLEAVEAAARLASTRPALFGVADETFLWICRRSRAAIRDEALRSTPSARAAPPTRVRETPFAVPAYRLEVRWSNSSTPLVRTRGQRSRSKSAEKPGRSRWVGARAVGRWPSAWLWETEIRQALLSFGQSIPARLGPVSLAADGRARLRHVQQRGVHRFAATDSQCDRSTCFLSSHRVAVTCISSR